jgi:hypothetical protein
LGRHSAIDSPITLVNPDHKPVDKPWPKRYVEEIGDGCALRHTDKSQSAIRDNLFRRVKFGRRHGNSKAV